MRRGQTTLEYVYLIGIAAVALVAMLVYISRGFQGRLRANANLVGEQYSPGNMSTNMTQTSVVTYSVTDTGTGASKVTDSYNQTTMTNSGTERINGLNQERY